MTGEMLIFRPVGVVFLNGGMIEDPEDINDFRNMVWTKETLYSDLKIGSLPEGMILKVKGYEPYVVVRNENRRQSAQKLVFLSTAITGTKPRRVRCTHIDQLEGNMVEEIASLQDAAQSQARNDKQCQIVKPRITDRKLIKATRVG